MFLRNEPFLEDIAEDLQRWTPGSVSSRTTREISLLYLWYPFTIMEKNKNCVANLQYANRIAPNEMYLGAPRLLMKKTKKYRSYIAYDTIPSYFTAT
ncbi:hypothetical protein NPIL_47321 [Nephila pilipes]|uniref:Uncharacterized protein n=1 Tax=Nephila pilipes TaxID=299642 RepID=A0A8X6IZ66_NEPPI|nr:hypothetical protein NPIL_47321 [Nephila pilipes]